MISMPTFSSACTKILSNFYHLSPKDFKPASFLTLPIPFQVCKFQYKIPLNNDFLDINWYGPFFLNQLKFDDFYYLLKAILLEKSVVFISKNHGLITSMANAFRILIKPFKWCHLFISLLPKLLIDYMCAPQPMILGISDREEFFSEIDPEACDEKILVECHGNGRPHVLGTFEIPDVRLGELKKKLRLLFKALKADNRDEMRSSVYDISTSELELSVQIANTIQNALQSHIIANMNKYKAKQKKSHCILEF